MQKIQLKLFELYNVEVGFPFSWSIHNPGYYQLPEKVLRKINEVNQGRFSLNKK